MIRIAPLLLLCGCLAAAPVVAEPPSNPDLALGAEAFAELVFDGAAGTTRGVDALRDMVAGWDVATRQDARVSVDALITTCPFNRIGAELPIALAITASRHDPAGVDIEVRATWRRIQKGLAQHVALLDDLGAGDLRMPRDMEYLGGYPSFLATRAELEAAADPMAVVADHLEQLPAVVEGLDPDTRRFLEVVHLDLDRATGRHGSWPFLLELEGWRAALMSIHPRIQDPALAQDVGAMFDALDAFLGSSC
jgi:hypothetical protein